MTFHPTDTCPACGNPRPWRHACACGDPGGMPRTLPERWPKWSKAERHLYAGQSVRVLGEVDRSGAMLVEMMSGPLTGLRRWMTFDELRLPPLLTTPPASNAAEIPATHAEPAQDAPNGDERTELSTREDATADGEINGCQVETGETAA
jgi:hypothetical protein